MQITRSSIDTGKGPTDWFTGEVYIDWVAEPAGTFDVRGGAGAFDARRTRTAWHTHPLWQTI